jgi:hypothetical protein
MYIAVAIGVLTVLILAWLIAWRKTRKSWCVMFYMVGRLPRTVFPVNWPDPVTGLPQGARLDAKLRDVLTALDSLPCSSLRSVINDRAWEDVHVVYRGVWDDIHNPPVARVVSWRLGAPSADYFAKENYDPLSIDLTDDLQFFFNWAFENCPADHYSVFFWGHSFGPGGLFEVAEKPLLPPPPPPLPPPTVAAGSGGTWPPPPPAALPPIVVPESPITSPYVPQLTFTSIGLTDLAGALLRLMNLRKLDQPDLVAAGQSMKIDVVAFQDCWMSTLETAYQLQDSAQYLIASQSLVPIGYNLNGQLPGAIWPYEDLIGALVHQQPYPDSLLGILKTFFDGTNLPAGTNPEFNRYPNPTLPYTLLDLGQNPGDLSARLTQPLVQLITALDIPSMSRANRRSLILQQLAGQLFKFSGADLQAGDVALIDVPIFCGYLQNSAAWPNAVRAALSAAEIAAIGAAAAALQNALTAVPPLVKGRFESAANAGLNLGFNGISVFYKGGQATPADPYLLQHVNFNYYKSLKFGLETTTLLATGAQTGWAKIAFE